MKVTNVKATVAKVMTVGLLAGVFALAAPAKANAQVVVRFGARAYYGDGDDGRRDYWNHEEHERQEEFARQQAYLQHEAWERHEREEAFERQRAYGYGYGYRGRDRDDRWEHRDHDRDGDGDGRR